MSMLDALNRAERDHAHKQAAEQARRAHQEAAEATLALRRQIGAGDPSPADRAPSRPAIPGPVAFASAHVRDMAMSRANSGPTEAVQPGPGPVRSSEPARAVQGATGQPGGAGATHMRHAPAAVPVPPDPIDTSILDSSDPDMAGALAFSASRQFKGRQGRARTRGCNSTPARPTANANDSQLDFGPLADPRLEQMAQKAANVTDQKALWRELIKQLKRIIPDAAEALKARDRVWNRRRAILAERKTVARARKASGAH